MRQRSLRMLYCETMGRYHTVIAVSTALSGDWVPWMKRASTLQHVRKARQKMVGMPRTQD